MSRIRWVVLSVLVAGTWGRADAGPPERRPLRPIADPDRPRPLDAPKELYYVSNGRKVPLFDTGMAVVKPRTGQSVATAKLALMFPESGTGLEELQQAVGRGGWALVNLDATESGLKTAAALPEIEWALPIVVAGGDDSGGSTTRLAMTPRIVADVVDRAKAIETASKLGLAVEDTGLRGSLVAFRLQDGPVRHDRLIDAANELAERGAENGSVRAAHPDFIPEKRRHQDPADPRYPGQWHLNHGNASGAPSADIDAPEAWAITTGVPGIRVAIIDDSVQGDHPDLRPTPDGGGFRVGRYYNGASGQTDPNPKPRTGSQRHGTPCAGVAVAVANDVGCRGAAPSCGLVGIHFWDASVAQTADAFRFAADPDGDPKTDDGAHVISCSWSWNASFDVVRLAIDEVATKPRPSGGTGIPVVFAAGNESGEVATRQWFGTLPNVICVAASSWRDDHSVYSNHGREVSVCAPSNDFASGALAIDTTDNTDDMPRPFLESHSGYAVGDYTGTGAEGFGGTSSATPLVAGVCALILSANPKLDAWQVRTILEHTADRIPGVDRLAAYDPVTSHDPFYGHGRVNAGAAVRAAVAVAATPGVPAWPLPATNVEVVAGPSGSALRWVLPPAGAKGALVVRLGSVGWRPTDGETYTVGQALPGGGQVLAVDASAPVTLGGGPAGVRFAVFTSTTGPRYGWGRMPNVPAPIPMGPVAADSGPTPADRTKEPR